MKMTKIIKKTDVIAALKKETLIRGTWFESTKYLEYKKNCRVCAVGAVLRKVSFEKWARNNDLSLGCLGSEAGDQNYTDKSYNELIENKEYLTALSDYFEDGNSKQDCITFVKKNFPKQFKLTIDSEDL